MMRHRVKSQKAFAGMVTVCLMLLPPGAWVVSAQSYSAITLPATELDSLYPGECSSSGCFPSLIPDGSTFVLGFTGAETHVAWKSVYFPGNPVGIVHQYGTPHIDLNLDYYLDGLSGPNSIYLWFAQLPQTDPAGKDFPIVWSDTFWIDYSLFPQIPFLEGTHDLFVQFTCGGAGCGNFQTWVFLFDAVQARPRRSLGSAGERAGTPRILGPERAGIFTPYRLTEGVSLFDVRGRQVVPNGGKPCRGWTGNDGILIAVPARGGQ